MSYSKEFLKAFRYFSEGDFAKARSLLGRIRTGNNSEAATAALLLATIDLQERKYKFAIEKLEKAHTQFKQDHRILTQLAETWMELGDYEQAIEWANRSLRVFPDNKILRLNLASWIASRSSYPEEIKQMYESWCQDYLDLPIDSVAHEKFAHLRNDGVLKVGFVSGDFKNHAVRYFIEPYLKHHNKNVFEVHAFMTKDSDEISEILKESVENWHEMKGVSTSDFFQKIQQLGIHILVDLSGHTEGERLEVFALRAAPVQVTWWGFMQTLGMREMDYRLTDSIFSPTGTDNHYTEKLWRMNCLTAYMPPVNCDTSFESPWTKNGYVTMVSINHSRKVSDEALRIWQRVLIHNPSASLIIVTMEKTPEGALALFQSRFEKFGMPMDRILAAPRLSMLEFMRLASIADFSLDSFPISGGVTTFHALWMGLPILTIKPQQPIPLQAYTSNILQTVGLNECIATDEASYLSIASKWINHPVEIEQIRKKCRSQLLMSPYMAIQERVTELENTFEKMWIEYKKANVKT